MAYTLLSVQEMLEGRSYVCSDGLDCLETIGEDFGIVNRKRDCRLSDVFDDVINGGDSLGEV